MTIEEILQKLQYEFPSWECEARETHDGWIIVLMSDKDITTTRVLNEDLSDPHIATYVKNRLKNNIRRKERK